MQQENDEVCHSGLTKGKKSCLPNMQSWLLEGLGRDSELPAQAGEERESGRERDAFPEKQCESSS